ncbi:class I SAM-dependent methyltransferase [Nocardioides sp. LHD-245]|uniref:class I SAM-dependent methyltransferase n=1 Tax=Nocardioides sp. LHD-245 TaxID=3051387 RepID=UPI0027DF34D0|nr:class I SAM-dependent methyltransferase [Nocardioides sp. LHD-245]
MASKSRNQQSTNQAEPTAEPTVEPDTAPTEPQVFDDFGGCLDLALNLISASDEPGLALEFGVSTGRTLQAIAAAMPAGSRVLGFDSFQGLPENWREGFPAGMFRASPPEIPGTELVIGLYADTLPSWEPDEVDPAIALVHIDCDLYSSTKTVLEHVGLHLEPGCLIVFDEFHSYPGAERHEAKAWAEWIDETGTEFTVLARGPEQLLVRLGA